MVISFFWTRIVLQKSRAGDFNACAGSSNPGDVDRRVADTISQQLRDGGGHHDTPTPWPPPPRQSRLAPALAAPGLLEAAAMSNPDSVGRINH